MKTWTITIEATNESEAVKMTKVLHESFKMAGKLNEPLHHIYADTKGKAKIECQINNK